MKLSIIIPVFNGAETIEKCLFSIINQGVSYNDYEIIVVNDCSTDNTGSIVEGFKSRITPPD